VHMCLIVFIVMPYLVPHLKSTAAASTFEVLHLSGQCFNLGKKVYWCARLGLARMNWGFVYFVLNIRHTHIYSHTHAQTHHKVTYTHAHTHARTHTITHTHSLAPMHIHTRAHTHTYTHAHTHRHITHTRTHTHVHAVTLISLAQTIP
jgi:hypothetical protein